MVDKWKFNVFKFLIYVSGALWLPSLIIILKCSMRDLNFTNIMHILKILIKVFRNKFIKINNINNKYYVLITDNQFCKL